MKRIAFEIVVACFIVAVSVAVMLLVDYLVPGSRPSQVVVSGRVEQSQTVPYTVEYVITDVADVRWKVAVGDGVDTESLTYASIHGTTVGVFGYRWWLAGERVILVTTVHGQR